MPEQTADQDRTRPPITPEEWSALLRLARRELARRRPRREGAERVTSLKLNVKLQAALKARADELGITLGEAMNRAIEEYLDS
jgi:hypothetical protein